MHPEPTFHEPRHVERLARSLHRILASELGAPVPLRVCCGAVVHGLSLRRDHGEGIPGFELGRSWSTAAALQFLAGRGFVFDPRLALEALTRLERRHILDRRRLVERGPFRGSAETRRRERRDEQASRSRPRLAFRA